MLVAGAFTLSLMLMERVPVAGAQSSDDGKTPTSRAGHKGKFFAQLDRLRVDIAKGDQERVNHDLNALFETIGSMPNTTAGRHEAQKLSEELWNAIRAQEERAALSY